MDQFPSCSSSTYLSRESQAPFLYDIFSRVQEHGGELIIPFSCVLEKNLVDMPEDEAAKYCEENKLQRQVQIFGGFLFYILNNKCLFF